VIHFSITLIFTLQSFINTFPVPSYSHSSLPQTDSSHLPTFFLISCGPSKFWYSSLIQSAKDLPSLCSQVLHPLETSQELQILAFVGILTRGSGPGIIRGPDSALLTPVLTALLFALLKFSYVTGTTASGFGGWDFIGSVSREVIHSTATPLPHRLGFGKHARPF
jgi:hypothetical protein